MNAISRPTHPHARNDSDRLAEHRLPHLHLAAGGGTWSQHELDRVFCDYRASEQRLRTALKNYQRISKEQRFIPTKLILEIAALAHRRKGTWA